MIPALSWGGTSPVSMSHPSLRASTPIACNCHIPCPNQSAPPTGLWEAHSSAIECAVLSERSDKFSISLTGCYLRPMQPGAPHSSFVTYLEIVHCDDSPPQAKTNVCL